MTKEIMQQALDALVYHTQQTRPIGRTKDAISVLEAVLARPVQSAVQVERERCAKVCDDEAASMGGVAAGPFVTDFGKHTHQSMAAGAMNCASAIRQGGGACRQHSSTQTDQSASTDDRRDTPIQLSMTL